MNELIRLMVLEEGAVLADPHAAFLREPSLEALFVDHVHPNDDGYRLIAEAFFQAITQPRSTQPASIAATSISSRQLLAALPLSLGQRRHELSARLSSN
jgi:hypothetical protein